MLKASWLIYEGENSVGIAAPSWKDLMWKEIPALPVIAALLSRILASARSLLNDSSLLISMVFHEPPPEIPKRMKEFLARATLYPKVSRAEELFNNPLESLVMLIPKPARGLIGV
jgi:hypothetical protein